MSPPAAAPVTEYEVVCGCGRTVRGERGRRHQVVPCPGCGRPLFVLPRSPWSAPAGRGGPALAGRLLASPWRWPVLAGAVSAVVIVAGFTIVLPYLARGKHRGENEPPAAPVASSEILAR